MSNEDRSFDSLMKLLTKYAKKNNLKECANVLQKALKMKPNDAELHRKMGWVYLYDGLSEKALECFRRSLELKGNRARAYSGIGAIRFNQKSFSSALENLKRSLSLGLDTWDLHYYLGVTYEKLGRLREAFDHLVKSADRNCPNAYCYNFLGEQLLKEKKYAEAEQKLLRAIELKLENAHTHYFLGVIYTKEQKSDLAIKHLKICLKSGLRLPGVYRDLGIAYMGKGLPERAEDQFKKIVKMNLKSPTGFEELCFLHIQWKKLDLAQECLEKARERGLPDDRWYGILGSISKAKGEVQSAIRFNKLALKNNPNNGLIHAQLGSLYDNQGNTSKAIFHFEKAFLIDPGVISVPFSLGLIYLRKNKLTQSKKLITALVAINEEDPLTQMLLAGYYLRRRNLKLAKRCAQKVIALDNTLAAGYYLSYLAYVSDNDPQQGLDFLEKAISLGAKAIGADFFSLGLTFYVKEMFGKAELCLQKVIEIDPECGDAYLPLATLLIFPEANYGLAHSMVELSERKPWRFLKREDFEIITTHVKTFSSGMVSWQRGEFNIAKNHFLECAKISESAHLTTWVKDGQFLASIVSFDERINLLISAPSFPVIMQDLDQLLREITTVTKEVLKESEKDNLLSLPIILAKGAIVLALNKILGEHSLDPEFRECLNKAQKRLEDLKLVRSIVVFDLIDTFAFQFSTVIAEFKELDRVPAEMVSSLLRSFRDILEHLGGKMSLEGMERRCATILEPYLKDFQAEMFSRRPTWVALDRFLKSQAQFAETGPTGMAEMKEKEKAKKTTAGVLFYRTRVEIFDGMLPRRPAKEYPWRLLELLLQRKRIHWTYGFLIFNRWRGDRGPEYPKKTINSYIGTLNGRTEDSLSHNKIPIEIEKDEETGEVYLDEYDRSKFSSNIFSAEERVKKVKDTLAKGDSEALEDAKKSLVDIIDGKEGYYNCYEAYKLLIQCLEKTGFKKEDERVITKVAEFFEEKILIHEESSYAIEEYRKKIPEVEYWLGTDHAIEDMQQDLEDSVKWYKIIAPHVSQKRVSREFLDIVRLIGQVKGSKLSPHRLVYKQKTFAKLMRKQSIKPMLNSVSLNILKDERLKNLSPEDIELAILPNFARVITRVRTQHFQSLPPLIKYLKTSTEQRTKEELIEREYEIPANILREMRRKSKVYNELVQESGQEPGDDKVYKRLGWSKEKQIRIRMYESNLRKVPGFNEQQYKGEML